MIDPALTVCPANTFTPSRCACESPRLGLYVSTLISSPRRCSTTLAETAPSSFERSVTTSSPPVMSTSGENVSPAACRCRSTRSVCPCSTRYCLPPTLITAYMLSFSTRKCPRLDGPDDGSRRRSLAQQPSQDAALAPRPRLRRGVGRRRTGRLGHGRRRLGHR